MNADDTPMHETTLVTRVFDAPVAKLWDAWADPDQLVQWWKADSSHGLKLTQYDFRPGGIWKQQVITPYGFAIGEHSPGSTFTEIIPHEKIVSIPNPLPDPSDAIQLVPNLKHTVILFEPIDDEKTRLTITLVHNRAIEKDWRPNKLHGEVYEAIFDHLAKHLAS